MTTEALIEDAPSNVEGSEPADARSARSPHRSLDRWLLGGAALILVVDQARFVMSFLRRFANEDVTMHWYAARDFGELSFRQPNFYGQSYHTVFESVVAVPIRWMGGAAASASAIAAAMTIVGGWFLLAVAANRRGLGVSAMAALACPVAISSSYLVLSEAPGGRGAGTFLVFAAAAMFVWPGQSRALDAAILAVAGVGLLWNFGMLPAVAVICAAMIPRLRSWRRALVVVGAGAAPPLAWLLFTRWFYDRRPSYDLHRSAFAEVDLAYLRANLAHPSRYLEDLTFELGGGWMLTLMLATGLCALLVRSRRWQLIVPVAAAVSATCGILSLNKSLDGSASPFFSFGRFLVAVPLAIWLLVAVAEQDGGVPLPGWITSRRVIMAVGAIALLSFADRQLTFSNRFHGLQVAGETAPTSAVGSTVEILDRCRVLGRLADDNDVSMVIFRYDRTSTYACGAEWYGHTSTLFPTYDRRTWIVDESIKDEQTRLMVNGVDSTWCTTITTVVDTCTLLSDGNTALITTSPRSTWATVTLLGIPTRPLHFG